jgi:Raf kinase inhibitor-like YbhB/YbcL family protein
MVLTGLLGLPIVGCNSSNHSTSPSGASVKTMKLESTAFAANQLIPTEYTCDGEDRSPPLNWSTPPERTQSLALIVDDPDAPAGTWVHWVVYNLPPNLRQLPEGIPSQPQLPTGGIHGKNDFGQLGYGGPCPPGGTHHYFFKLYALDQTLNLTQGATKAELLKAMEGHILANAELMARYTRQR